MRNWGGKLHCFTTSLVGWSDAAYGDLLTEGKCRLEVVIGLMFPSLTGQRRILRGASEFSRKVVKRSLGGEVCARSVTVEHMALMRDSSEPFSGLAPGMASLADCESLFTHL